MMIRKEKRVSIRTHLQGLISLLMVTVANALLLCDLPTPSLVIDLMALQKQVTGSPGSAFRSPTDIQTKKKVAWKPPCLRSPSNVNDGNTILLDPIPMDSYNWLDSETHTNVEESIRSPVWTAEGICYLHTRVTRAREDCQPDEDPETFLAQLDLLPKHMQPTDTTLSQQRHLEPPTLVLGLNNHHVISYYWARSAGAGAAMEAPGIVYDERGQLRWRSRKRTDDNTNDGKRSEWVNFLRVGDAVQLLPQSDSVPDVLCAMGTAGRMYGISSQGRPLGSEPGVVCQWQLRAL